MRTFDEALDHVLRVSHLSEAEKEQHQHQFLGDVENSKPLKAISGSIMDWIIGLMADEKIELEGALFSMFMNGIVMGVTVGVYMESQEIVTK